MNARPLKFRLLELGKGCGRFWMEGKGWDLYSIACSYREMMANNDKFRLIQFTGLLDRNGKEIYEGDIVKYRSFSTCLSGRSALNAVGVVTSSKYGTWIIEGQKSYQKGMPFENQFCGKKNAKREDEEVIGNIYENPELMT